MVHFPASSSEESGDASDDSEVRVLRRKPLPWRSPDANAFMLRCDAYYKPKKQTELAARMSRPRSKAPGHVSTRPRPSSAPAWALTAPPAPQANNNANHNGQPAAEREANAPGAGKKPKGRGGR